MWMLDLAGETCGTLPLVAAGGAPPHPGGPMVVGTPRRSLVPGLVVTLVFTLLFGGLALSSYQRAKRLDDPAQTATAPGEVLDMGHRRRALVRFTTADGRTVTTRIRVRDPELSGPVTVTYVVDRPQTARVEGQRPIPRYQVGSAMIVALLLASATLLGVEWLRGRRSGGAQSRWRGTASAARADTTRPRATGHLRTTARRSRSVSRQPTTPKTLR